MSHQVYQLSPGEYSRYTTHLLALDSDSRYTRFGTIVKDEMIEQLCQRFETNYQQHKIFVIEDEQLVVIAAGHIALEGGQTELAYSVLNKYRNRGMGSSLMTRTIEWCQNRNIQGGCMVCLSSNTAIKKLASKHGVLINNGGETMANITIPTSTATSVLNEIVDNNLAQLDHLGKLQRNFVKAITFPLLFK